MRQNHQTWLLLRGLVREKRHWGDFPQQLKQAFPNDRILCIDLPGNGVRNSEKSPTKIEFFADFLHLTVLELQRQSTHHDKLIVVSLSLGAMVAVEWNRKYPKDFDQLIMINTSFRGVNPFFKRLRPQNYLKFLKIMFTKNIRKRESQILSIVSNESDKREKSVPLWTKIQNDRPVSRLNSLRQLLAATLFTVPSKAPSVPTLILTSYADRLAHWTCSQEIAKKWQLEIKKHQSAGHDLTLDDPQWVIKNLKDWVYNQVIPREQHVL